ncbi:hypothetical protein [Paludisphaera mucosa]|uniref:Yip1 domain-containing protein n=1 Tax=Paludisphaera mucosa TaxID=3030827 RepID=A0ABT6FC86_9BACT|nr:hypothetical protein [Paludisphaera mucosa]MDG3005205.1 hypothetical protein [Paludisphaera mucosa]
MELAATLGTSGSIRVEEPRGAPMLGLWLALMLALYAAMWASGGRSAALTTALEGGVTRIERDGAAAPSDEAVRKAVAMQRAAFGFWATVRLLGDFLFEPAAMALRAGAAAVGFTACAALAGRPLKFEPAWAGCVRLQGWWVLGLAVRLGLVVWLRRSEDDVDTSLALFLPPGTHQAAVWLALRGLDAFAIVGWLALALAGRRRGDANLAVALGLCGVLGAVELAARVGAAWFVGSAMRLALIAS